MRKKLIILFILAGIIAILSLHIYNEIRPKRYAVFAGFNAKGKIADYVISYIKGLNEVSDGVVYIADSSIYPEELEKIKNITIHTEHQRHEEYDWGSYKRGFNWLKDNGYLKKADELIFANDSCYAPMTSFKPMFEKMSQNKDIDFWGNTQNIAFKPHIQSYFMVFRKPVINSKKFASFINNVTHQINNAGYIANYEIQLPSYLANFGYKWDTYIPYQELSHLKEPDNNSYPLTLIRDYNNQFLKRRTFTTHLTILEDRHELLKYIHQNYPTRYQEIKKEINPKFIPTGL